MRRNALNERVGIWALVDAAEGTENIASELTLRRDSTELLGLGQGTVNDLSVVDPLPLLTQETGDLGQRQVTGDLWYEAGDVGQDTVYGRELSLAKSGQETGNLGQGQSISDAG